MTRKEIIEKYLPSSVPFTPDQTEAITARGDILVSASAGSGKTAVLVERILRRLLLGEVSADRLLVVTFTNAAAAQMKRKLSESVTATVRRITRKLADKPPYDERVILDEICEYMKLQAKLIPAADIMTIDAFCQKAVRANFQALGIDPRFSIFDPVVAEITAENVFEELCDELSGQNDEAFRTLSEVFAPNYSEKTLAERVLSAYSFSLSFPHPEKWLLDAAEMYDMPFEYTPWYKCAVSSMNRAADNALDALGEMVREFCMSDAEAAELITEYSDDEMLSARYGGLWRDFLFGNYRVISEFKEMSWDERRALVTERGAMPNFTRAQKPYKTLKKDRPDEAAELDELKDRADAVIKAFRDDMKDNWLSSTLADTSANVKESAKTVRALVDMTIKFSEAFSEKKQEMNVMEFANVEHLCLRLFEEHDDIRTNYALKYDEILIDEYQDTNNLQETIFQKITRGHGVGNCFMVGDMKQSIYRFRNSDPYIFREKSERYALNSAPDERRISLSRNFRSRGAVLEAINDIFCGVMTADEGDIEYEPEKLSWDPETNNGYGDYNDGPSAELYWCECTDGEDTMEVEAKRTAELICSMVESGFMVRSKTGARRMRYSDAVILASSVKPIANAFTAAFAEHGVGCTAENSDFFDRSEIMIITSLLKIIVNPRQDIPLIAVMLSPVGGFSEDDLVALRLMGDGDIYTLIEAGCESQGSLGYRCRTFTARLKRYRREARRLSVERLIWYLYADTKLYDFFGAADDTGEAQANMRLLFERAKQFANNGFKSLFDFVRYIERLERDGISVDGATGTAAVDSVRIMTIHKSKGLEFPVVVLASAGKNFASQELKGAVLMHKDLGIALDLYDTVEFTRTQTVAKSAVRERLAEEMRAEEMRKLYVALTRAQEKLIVLTSGDLAKHFNETEHGLTPKGEAKGFFSWLIPMSEASDNWELHKCAPEQSEEEVPEEPAAEENQEETEQDLKRAVGEILSFKYKFEQCRSVPSKVSVTSMKEKFVPSDEGAECIAAEHERSAATGLQSMPEFMRAETRAAGARLGTLYHSILEKSDLNVCHTTEDAKRTIAEMCAAGEISERDASAIVPEKLGAFYESDIAERIRNAESVIREAPFEIEIPVSAYESTAPPDAGTMLLQGIIDCCFVEDGEAVLVDYKSDYYANPDARRELEKKYAVQLKWYAAAIEQSAHLHVKEAYLYLLHGSEAADMTQYLTGDE